MEIVVDIKKKRKLCQNRTAVEQFQKISMYCKKFWKPTQKLWLFTQDWKILAVWKYYARKKIVVFNPSILVPPGTMFHVELYNIQK